MKTSNRVELCSALPLNSIALFTRNDARQNFYDRAFLIHYEKESSGYKCAVISTTTRFFSPQRLKDFLTITMNARWISVSKPQFRLAFFVVFKVFYAVAVCKRGFTP